MSECANNPSTSSTAVSGIGQRLRQGRERLGLSVAEAATRMRLSAAVVEALEAERFESLGAAVYLRGYLNSYARLVELPLVAVDSAIAKFAAPPPELRSATHVSPGRRLAERYARQAVYIVLTASIVVPVAWLATQERLPVDAAALRSLDVPPAATLPVDIAARPAAAPEAWGPPRPDSSDSAPKPVEEPPVMASFAPFINQRTEVAPPDRDSGWRLRFVGDSWVEVLDPQGRRLEYGLVRAGSERRFPAGSVARVALGNAGAVEVSRDGVEVPLAPFQRANVARFRVSSGGELEPAGG